MSDTPNVSEFPNAFVTTSSSCEGDSACCGGDEPHPDDQGHSHDVRIDGAGEPCPTPLMWQEVRENYLRDSTPWQIHCGSHQLVGRTWGEGTPIYFLNNFAATAELLSLTVWLLRDQFRCVVFDAVTENRREAIRTRPSMNEFANDLFAVADQHQDERFTVYGSGFGAAVAMQSALSHPSRVDRLILQHGFGVRRLTVFERLLAAICLRSGQTLNSLPQRRRFQAVNHRPWFPPFDPSRFDFLIDSSGTLPLRDLARRALAVNSFDVVSRLAEISCPVMLIRTEGEGRQAADSQAVLESQIKQSRVEWLHSAGQHPCLTHPHRVAKLIRSFSGTEAE